MPDIYESIGIVVSLALITWAVYGRLRKDPAAPLTDKLAMISQAVAAAEQMYRSGQLGPSERLDYALDLIDEWYPGMEIDTAKAHIEAAVFWLKGRGPQVLAPGGLPESGDDDDGLDALENWR